MLFRSPFRLAYGADAVIPVEIGLTSYRVQSYTEDKNEEAMRLQLDLVDEVRDDGNRPLLCKKVGCVIRGVWLDGHTLRDVDIDG